MLGKVLDRMLDTVLAPRGGSDMCRGDWEDSNSVIRLNIRPILRKKS